MATFWGKSCSFALLCDFFIYLFIFVNVFLFFFVRPSFPFGFKDGMWGLIVLILDHCLSMYLFCII